MRLETSVTSISWIPSEAISGTTRAPFDLGIAHYDEPPPEALSDAESLRDQDRFRFCNRLRVEVEIEEGRITSARYTGGGLIGATTMRLGPTSRTFQAFSMPDLRGEPEHGIGWVRFTQTAGGRTGVPMPRKVRHPPFVQWHAPLAWTTLSLTVHADGAIESGLAGASTFPRHWVYDHDGALLEKSGLIDFKKWSSSSFGRHSPWGDERTEIFVTAVETALERTLSAAVMRGSRPPAIRTVKRGKALVEQGGAGDEVFLVLDGVIGVEVDGGVWPSTGRARSWVSVRRSRAGGGRPPSWRSQRARLRPCTPTSSTARSSRSSQKGTAGKRSGPARPVRVHFCGVRGSTPAPGPPFVRYGGYTSCLAIARDGAAAPTLLLDAGTGIRRVTDLLGGEPFYGTILLTHLHWDHTHGLPFFRGCDHDESLVSLLLPDQLDGQSARDVLARGMSPPHFPVAPDELRGTWRFELASPGSFEAEGFKVTALEVPHKGGRTFGYRVSDGRATLAYVPDHCPTELGPGEDGLGARHDAAMALAGNVDALVHDSQLRAEEVAKEAQFGHAAAEYAVGLGREALAKRIVLFHHKPDRTDDALDALAASYAQDGDVIVASEDLVLTL